MREEGHDGVGEQCPDMRQQFYTELTKARANVAKNSVFLSQRKYEELLEEVSKAKGLRKKQPRDYWLLKRFDVLNLENQSKLIWPCRPGDSLIFYVPEHQLFDAIQEAHLKVGHGGRERTAKEVGCHYKNITRREIELYIQLCRVCQNKHKGPAQKKGLPIQPLISSELHSRASVSLMDFQSQPDGDYHFILVYQDLQTKFIMLKALKSQSPDEVADSLIDTFTLLGAPSILQSNHGSEFASKVVSCLKQEWPALKVVYGDRPCQISVEQIHQDIENMLCAWMLDAKTDRWSKGLRYVQLMKNRAFHSSIKKSPFEALFGSRLKLGLTTSSIPQDALINVHTEEDLQKIVQSFKTSPLEEGEEDDEDEDPELIITEPEISLENIKEEPSSPSVPCDTFLNTTNCASSKVSAPTDPADTNALRYDCVSSPEASNSQKDENRQQCNAKRIKMDADAEAADVPAPKINLAL